ncbi:MAG: DNA-directed RNA polymerase subunit beta' [Dehalococcoidia bacterium]|nr:DNA-directed RNA polymerase subunit beta' [Dehalococcoidia bacterium]
MPETNDFNAIRISLASPEQIRNWSYGEVTKPETINYRTLKPEKDGLFCERIFGPTKDFECYCGKYKRVRYRGIVCDRCGVEVARSKVRRERMGHIELAAPVAHIWFSKGTPSRIGLLLDLSPRSLERVLYFAQYVVTSVDETERARLVEQLQKNGQERIKEKIAEVEKRISELQTGAATALKELQVQREAAEKAAATELKAAEAAVDEEIADFRAVVEKAEGKKAAKNVSLFGDTIFSRGDEMAPAILKTIAKRREAQLEHVRAEHAESKLNKTEDIDAQIESLREHVDKEVNQMRRNAEEARLTSDDEVQGEVGDVEEVRPRMVLPESRWRELRDKYGAFFKAGMGAEAVLECLQGVDLEKLREDLGLEIKSTSGQRRKKAAKTLRVVEAFRKSGNKPEWMIMRVLPVLPPDLRPMVQLDGGRFATSDLNDLYRRTINRNNRLRRLLDLGAPEIIIRNEKRMLQEAVDALIDNGRRGRAIEGSHNHRLKSLSDMLRGKQGRFRQNLLGKRVDYSGRSVIVVGPELKLNQCGLPKKMALELFKPMVMHRLVALQLAHNIKSAKRMVERVRPEVWDVLEDVIKNRPVFLNRAPTLHRLGIQAFQPILIEGSAIQIHPLVCAAFNADFDGDQMAVHVPLSRAAVIEANHLMMSTRNMLSPSSGDPVVAPTLDMVLGCFYITTSRKGAMGEGKRFPSPEDAIQYYDLSQLDLQAEIEVKGIAGKEGFFKTTVGRIIFNNVVPAKASAAYRNGTMDKKALRDLVSEVHHVLGDDETGKMLDDIKRLGFRYATQSGATIAINDIRVPEVKKEIVGGAEREVLELDKQFQRGLITHDEQYRQAVDIWTRASDRMEQVIKEHLPSYGSIYMMATSGAKGNIAQIKQMAGMRGLMTDPRGRIIELPIKASFREGLSVLEYFISTHGARKGLADTALRTADSGYLTRRLVDVSQDVIVMHEDCGTLEGAWIMDHPDRPLLAKYEERITGRIAASPVLHPVTDAVLVERGQEIDEKAAKTLTTALHDYRLQRLKAVKVPADDLEKAASTWVESVKYLVERKKMSEEQAQNHIGLDKHRLHARSPLNCEAHRGVCRLCYGRSLARGRLVEQGEAVGIIAAQSIGEPGTQLTMRTFHTGGVAGLDITSGLPRVEELFEARAPKGQAVISEIDGQIDIAETEEGRRITVTHTETYNDEYLLPKGFRVLVEESSLVEVGTPLAHLVERGKAPAEGKETRENTVTARLAGRVTVEKGRLQVSYQEQEERHYAIPAAAQIVVKPGQSIRAGDQLTAGPINPQDILRILGREKVQDYMVEEVQKVYRAQGVTIHDKHIEIVVRQMLRKVRVETAGDTELLSGQMLDRFAFEEINAKVVAEGGEPATAQPVLLGVTKASLNTESFLAAASFQETTRVLTEAAVSGTVDRLMGPKENVIIGRLIPARSAEVQRELAKPSPVLSLLQPLDADGLGLSFGEGATPVPVPEAGLAPVEEDIEDEEIEDEEEETIAEVIAEPPVPSRVFEPEVESPRGRTFYMDGEETK